MVDLALLRFKGLLLSMNSNVGFSGLHGILYREKTGMSLTSQIPFLIGSYSLQKYYLFPFMLFLFQNCVNCGSVGLL